MPLFRSLLRAPAPVPDPGPDPLDPTGVGHDAIGVIDLVLEEREVEPAGHVFVDDAAERLLRRFIGLCEHPRTRERAARLVRGSVRDGRRVYPVLNRVVLSPVARSTGLPESALRWELVASQLVGMAMMRYVLEVEPIASLDVDELVARMAPAVRAALATDAACEVAR